MDVDRFAKSLGIGWLPFQQRESTSKIFVSYRREDARGDAGRLTDKLKSHFGEKQIFRDVEAIEAVSILSKPFTMRWVRARRYLPLSVQLG